RHRRALRAGARAARGGPRRCRGRGRPDGSRTAPSWWRPRYRRRPGRPHARRGADDRGTKQPPSILGGVVPRPSSRLVASRLRGPRGADRRRTEVLHGDGSPLRIGPWQGQHRVASVAPVHGGVPCAVADVHRAVAVLEHRGYAAVVTAALAPLDQAAFLTAGFSVHERLHLLARDLPPAPVAPLPRDVVLRRGQAPDRAG